MRKNVAETMLSGYVVSRPEGNEVHVENPQHEPSVTGVHGIRRRVMFADEARHIEWESHSC